MSKYMARPSGGARATRPIPPHPRACRARHSVSIRGLRPRCQMANGPILPNGTLDGPAKASSSRPRDSLTKAAGISAPDHRRLPRVVRVRFADVGTVWTASKIVGSIRENTTQKRRDARDQLVSGRQHDRSVVRSKAALRACARQLPPSTTWHYASNRSGLASANA